MTAKKRMSERKLIEWATTIAHDWSRDSYHANSGKCMLALHAAHAKAKRELALIRKLARMSGVDKHWWKVGGVKL